MAKMNFYTENYGTNEQGLVSLEDQRKLYSQTSTDVKQNEKIDINEQVNIEQSKEIDKLKSDLNKIETKVNLIGSGSSGSGGTYPISGVFDAGTF